MRAALGCALISCCLLTGAARLETHDAKILRGEVTFDDGSFLVKPEGGDASVRVGIDELKAIAFRDFKPQPLVVSNTGGLVDPWTSSDLGTVHLPGSVAIDQTGTMTIEASGWGVWAGDDSLHLAYRLLEGDGQLVAHVRSVAQSPAPLVVGVMIREDMKAGCNMAATCLYPTGQIRFHRRASDGPPSLGSSADSKGNTWIRLTRRGDLFTAYDSADGQTWQRIDSRTIPMQSRALAGVGAWTTSNSARGRAIVDSISIVEGTAGTAVSLTDSAIDENIVFRDGTVRGGVIVSTDDASLSLVSHQQNMSISRDQIARIILCDSATSLDSLAGQTGLLLRNGDFIEGEVTAIAVSTTKDSTVPQRKISLTSAVFGIKEIDFNDVAAVLIRDVARSSARYQVRTADGSILYGNSIDISKSGVSLDTTAIGDVVAIEDRQTKSTH